MSEPYKSLYDNENRPEELPSWPRLLWWAQRHARAGRASALAIWFQMFAEGRRAKDVNDREVS